VTIDEAKANVLNTRLVEITTKLEQEAAGPAPTCSSFLRNAKTSEMTWQSMLDAIRGRVQHGITTIDSKVGGKTIFTIDDEIAAFTYGDNPGDKTRNMTEPVPIGVNDNGPFFQTKPLDPKLEYKSRYPPASAQYQAETLLHELSHLVVQIHLMPEGWPKDKVFFPDIDPSTDGRKHNRDVLEKQCGVLIRTFSQ
jgi:hypothetical protein